jgi:hypothetical protein
MFSQGTSKLGSRAEVLSSNTKTSKTTARSGNAENSKEGESTQRSDKNVSERPDWFPDYIPYER